MDLIVASASDMVNALPELAKDFQARTGVKVVPSFGPSGALAQQIAHGAPFDVFLSADRRFIAQLVDRKFIAAAPSSRVVYAIGHLVLYSPKIRMTELAGLRRPEVQRFAIANPELAPYGRAARQALERAGLWNEVQSKVVIAENIRQALQMVESGNVDAALTSRSLLSGSQGETLLDVPSDLYEQIQQEAGIISRASGESGGGRRLDGATNPDARAFLDYLVSANGKVILQRYGFGIPK
jgi:molybdate transport system substrate-binding protein